ncbi:Glycosyltransferase, GT2 family [Bradyrhizobium erythrophlei]|nr:Glycosyltransferase, GT2 family [Bradyrhizobium erythrophlei]
MQTSESITPKSGTNPTKFGVVVIGRNEGQRLITCLRSVTTAAAVVYVDSNSTDGSVQAARDLGSVVIELDLSIPFTAARARNAGFASLLTILPGLPYVQFVDGDCELAPGWPEAAVTFLDRQADVAAVCGRLRERYPDQSVYNWLCDKEWDRPTGEVRSFAGNVMMRAQALKGVGAYREDMIAGEEEELSVRLRQASWRIWRLAEEMALHDAAMLHFGQWWKRTTRAGYAFAQGSHLHGAPPERHLVREARRAMVWGLVLPLACLMATIAFLHFGWIAWLVYPMQLARLSINNPGPPSDRVALAFFQLLARFPEGLGLAMFCRDLLLDRRPQLIEHKRIPKRGNM